MLKKIATLKEVKEDYYVIQKGIKKVTIGNKEIDMKKFYEICESLDYFENQNYFDDDILNNGYIQYSDREKKVSEEEEEQIRNDTGSIEKLAKKYGYSAGTIHKIKKNTYR